MTFALYKPQKRRFTSPPTGPTPKFTITLTAAYEPVTGSLTNTTVKFPVLNKPADATKPVFPMPQRQVWTLNDWVLGWGQYRHVDAQKFWYGTVHSFRDGELSAGAKINAPSTDIGTASHDVEWFAEYGTTRTLYAVANKSDDSAGELWTYNHTTEVWSKIGSGYTGTGNISEIQEINGVLYVCQDMSTPANYFTLTNTTWANGGSEAHHFALHPVGGEETAASLLKVIDHTVYWGSGWSNSVAVGGSEDKINALISFKDNLIALKSDGLYTIAFKSATEAVASSYADFNMQRSPNTGKHWVIWSDRLWFNLGTSLASFDGTAIITIEYPWAVSPSDLGDIYSLAAMDEVLLIGFKQWVLAYHDHGVGLKGDFHYVAYVSNRNMAGLWFSRIAQPNRVWLGLDDTGSTASSTRYLKFTAGLFTPAEFAASSVYYTSWFDAGDKTVTKWAMQVYVEPDNCDANNYITLARAVDGSAEFTDIGGPTTLYPSQVARITTDAGVVVRPANGYISSDTDAHVAFRSIQLRGTIVSAGSVTPIIKSIDLVYAPRPPDKRSWDMVVMCSDEWEVGSENARYTAQQYREFLWAASQQDTPVILVDEYDAFFC